MTREEARQNLVALGIEEPTEAQVTNYLNQFHSNRNQNTNTQNQTNEILAQANAQNQTQQQNSSGNEELDGLRQQIADLQRENAKKDILAYAVSKGLTGDQVQNILNAFGENVEIAKQAIDSMAQIISDNRAAAAQEKEEEIARNASNPGGGSGNGGDTKSQPEQIVTKLFGGQKQSNDILSHYVNGGN